MQNSILITGAAGFIGFHLAGRLLKTKNDTTIIGIDDINDYYDIALKHARLAQLKAHGNFIFIKADIAEREAIRQIFRDYKPGIVINLAAQAGVRYSITNPEVYIRSNINGFFNILEACREFAPHHLIYASSSSVYGGNTKVPFAVTDMTDTPISLYAATKKSNELMAHSYASLFGLKITGLRFFTVYGPYGRPDMAMFLFTDKMVSGKPIELFNHGDMERDFTYVDDVAEGIIRIIQKPPGQINGVHHKVYNIGNSNPEKLTYLVDTLQQILTENNMMSSKPEIKYLPMQPGDVRKTYADTAELEKDFGYKPSTRLEDGIRSFVTWYKEYNKI